MYFHSEDVINQTLPKHFRSPNKNHKNINDLLLAFELFPNHEWYYGTSFDILETSIIIYIYTLYVHTIYTISRRSDLEAVQVI